MRGQLGFIAGGLVLLVTTAGGSPAVAAVANPVKTFYVDPVGGDDDFAGTSTSTAFKSIDRARRAVAAVNKSMTGNIYVYLRGGVHTEALPVSFGAGDSGTNGYKVYYKNYTGELPVVSGGEDITTGWEETSKGSGLWKRHVGTANFRHLYVNSQPAIRARTPNKTNTDSFGPFYRTIGADLANGKYQIKSTEIARWKNLSKVEMVVQPHWYHNRLRISDFTIQNGTASVSFQPRESGYAFAKEPGYYQGSSYHFENAYEFLDAEGEWYLDTSTQTLYYRPRVGEAMNRVSIVAGKLETLFNLAGTPSSKIHDLAFEGLVFQHTDWKTPGRMGLVATQGVWDRGAGPVTGAIQVSYGTNLRFADNTFRSLGGDGLQFVRGVENSRIVGNEFRSIAANAINLDVLIQKNPASTEKTSRILIGNNTIARMGQSYSNGMGILAGFISDSIIEHNDISHGPYMGMQIGNQAGGNVDVGMEDNWIRYNDVHHVMQLHDDGGGIYTLARQYRTLIHENWVHDVQRSPWAMSFPVAGVYLDNHSEFITAQRNVLQRNAENIYEQDKNGAKNNVYTRDEVLSQATIQAITSKAGVVTNYVEPTTW